MGEQALAEFDVDPVRGVGQRIGAEILQGDVEHADDRKARDQHEQSLVSSVGQDLVDDDLKEQRRRQCENLHEE
jgi:hypothetical protein